MTSANKNLRAVFFVGFLLTIALSITGYIDSSFVGMYSDIKKVGILFSIGSVVSILMLSYSPKIISKIGVSGIFYTNATLYLSSILIMLATQNNIIFELFFIIYLASGIGIYYAIDVLIEHFSKKETTGNTRGFYLAIYNLAFLIGPLLTGIILKNNGFDIAYLMAGVFIILMTILYTRDLEKFDFKGEYRQTSFWKSFLKLTKNKNLFKVYLLSLSLTFFFSWMSIYTPIYLNQYIGFNWTQIGIIFALMHIPYVTLEIPIGKISDKLHCEKELIAIGLLIIGVSTAFMSKIISLNLLPWALILIATRTGASLVQVGTESYFFKKVTEKDAGIIAVFRNAAPVAYIIGPVLGTIFLQMVSYQNLFIILGTIMILSMLITFKMKNTK